MDLIKDPLPKARIERTNASSFAACSTALERLLLGRAEMRLLPSTTEVASAAMQLASATKRRVVLPVASTPAELVLERRGEDVFVSLHSTTATPEVFLRDRRIPLRELLAAASFVDARSDLSFEVASLIAERVRATSIVAIEADELERHRSSAFDEPEDDAPVSFAFEANFRGACRGPARGVRADIHALLFEGVLVAHLHGRRLVLARGPIALAVLRMLHAARSFLEGRALRNPPNVRMRVGSFSIGLRGDADGKVSLSLEGERGGSITAAGLDLAQALVPISTLANEIVRALVAFDRSQGRNLRVRAMRDDIRAIARTRSRRDELRGFVNADADRMRALAMVESSASRAMSRARSVRPTANNLRYGERWRVALDGLDAASTFLCGDRLVISTSHHTLALSRDDGTVLWARESENFPCAMAGETLLRARPDGVIELCSVLDGEAFAEAKLGSQIRGTLEVFTFGGDASTPPVAIVRESSARLVALDLRTGELIWRFGVRRNSTMSIARLGRMLVIGSDDVVHGLDAITGEELFRHVEEDALVRAVVASNDRVACVVDRPEPTLVLLDAFRGEALVEVALPGPIRGEPLALDGGVVLACGDSSDATLLRFDSSGERIFEAEDIGLAKNASTLVVDGTLVSNDVDGKIRAIDVVDGSPLWTQRIARPIDDVPRIRKPLLRAGVLFVPGADVRIVRPADGTLATTGFPCDLVPDRLLVDERTWVFVAEESGHVAAYAPAAHLTLIRGGGL